jgi:hypothetical protein
MKIYTFYDNEIHSLEVRETKSRLIAKERHPAFGWGIYINKNRFATSERGAIDLAINRRMKKKIEMERGIEKIDHEFNVLDFLLDNMED